MVSWVCLQFVIVVFPDHTHFLFIIVISVIARLGFKDRVWFTLHVMTEMHFLLQKNLKNIMHGRVKMYVMH